MGHPFMSEAEAKTKWCPFSRVETNDGAGINRPSHVYIRIDDDADVHKNTRCIASGCMAWQRVSPRPDNWQPGEDLPLGRCGLVSAR